MMSGIEIIGSPGFRELVIWPGVCTLLAVEVPFLVQGMWWSFPVPRASWFVSVEGIMTGSWN